MESSDSKLALLLVTDLFSLNGMNFEKVVTNNELECYSITVEVSLKGFGELFKQPLVIQEANATTNSSNAEMVNAIEEISGSELTLMPILLGWTEAKQCLTNPCEFGDYEAWLTKKT